MIVNIVTIHHCKDSCNKCAGKNTIHITDTINGHVSECETKCAKCGHADYWAYGYFESGAEIKSNCKTYNVSP